MKKHNRWLAGVCALLCMPLGFTAAACEGEAACMGDGEGLGVAEGEVTVHAADPDGNGLISLSELLRVIQFFNTGALSCNALSEDGYAPGGVNTECTPHSSDYAPQNWIISLSELLRLIQFFNGDGYHPCADGEDGFCSGQPDNTPPPNVVFIILDTLRSKKVEARRGGLPVMPFLADFAAQGADFRYATSPSSWTRPSIASYFTGLYPGVLRGAEELPFPERYKVPDELVSMPEWFSSHGYDCWGIQSNSNAGPSAGLDQGFTESQYQFLNFNPAALITDAALETMPNWREPFFSFVQYIDPHGPYAPPTEYNEVFGPQPSIEFSDVVHLSPMGFSNYVRDLYGTWVTGSEPELTPLSDNGRVALRYRYDAEIRYLDDELARFAGAVETTYPNTIFVLVSDHGEALMEREELIGHGHTLFEDQTRVPLIFKGPGISPQSIETRVEALGILPALANLLGLTGHPQWQGSDPFAQAANPEPVFAHTTTAFEDIPVTGESVTWNGLKLIDHSQFSAPHLYDLTADPTEDEDVAAARPADVDALSALLAGHIASLAEGK